MGKAVAKGRGTRGPRASSKSGLVGDTLAESGEVSSGGRGKPGGSRRRQNVQCVSSYVRDDRIVCVYSTIGDIGEEAAHDIQPKDGGNIK